MPWLTTSQAVTVSIGGLTHAAWAARISGFLRHSWFMRFGAPGAGKQESLALYAHSPKAWILGSAALSLSALPKALSKFSAGETLSL